MKSMNYYLEMSLLNYPMMNLLNRLMTRETNYPMAESESVDSLLLPMMESEPVDSLLLPVPSLL